MRVGFGILFRRHLRNDNEQEPRDEDEQELEKTV